MTARKKPAKTKRPWPKRLLRGFLWFVLALLALLGAGCAYLHSSAGEEMIRARIEQRLGERVNGSVSIGKVSLDFLGPVSLHDVAIRDESGNAPIQVGMLRALPNYGEIVDGNIVIDEIAIERPSVTFKKYEDGSSNLKQLFKPRDKPLELALEVRRLEIAELGLVYEKFDGLSIDVADLAVSAALTVDTKAKRFKVDVPSLRLALLLERPSRGLSLDVSELQTGLGLDMTDGQGTVKLHPTQAKASIALGDRKPPPIELGLDGIELSIRDGKLDASLENLLLGALALRSFHASAGLLEGKLEGSQTVELDGLTVGAEDLNALLSKPVLREDVTIGLKVGGPPEALTIDTQLDTAGAHLALKGKVDARSFDDPGFDVELTLDDVDTRSIVREELAIPPAKLGSLGLSLKGHGKSKETLQADIGLDLEDVEVRGITVDRVSMRGKVQEGVANVDELTVEALGQTLRASASYRFADKDVKLELSPEGDIGELLAKLKEAGIAERASVPPGVVVLRKGDLVVKARGKADGALHAEVDAPSLRAFGGAIRLDADADVVRLAEPDASGRTIRVDGFDVNLGLAGISLGQILALRGKRLDDLDVTLSGHVVARGTPTEPQVVANVAARAQATDGDKPAAEVQLAAIVNKHQAIVDLDAKTVDGTSESPLLALDAALPLWLEGETKGLNAYAPWRVDVTMPERRIDSITAVLPDRLLEGRTIPEGSIRLEAGLRGSQAAPKGSVDLTARVEAALGLTQKLVVHADIEPDAETQGGTAIAVTVDGWLDERKSQLVDLDADVAFSRSPLVPGPKTLGWELEGKIGPADLGELPVDTKGWTGQAGLELALSGTREDVFGEVHIEASEMRKQGKGPLDLDAKVELREADARVDVLGSLAGADLVALEGTVGFGGQRLIPRLKAKEHRSAPLDLQLTLVRNPLGIFTPFSPKLESVEGELSGGISIGGRVDEPSAKGTILVDAYETVAGGAGAIAIQLDAEGEPLSVAVEVQEDALPLLTIGAAAQRSEVLAFRAGEGKLPVEASIRADGVGLKRLVPAFAVRDSPVDVEGKLSSDLTARAELDKIDGATKLVDGSLGGAFRLTDGTVVLPGGSRTYDDVHVEIVADAAGLSIERIAARESDAEREDRAIDIEGRLALDRLRPTELSVSLTADEWLVFGGRFGEIDAPRASLTIDAGVQGWLDRSVRRIDVEVHSLALISPDRFERAHQPEDMNGGDIVFIEGSDAIGKLPVPEEVAQAAEAESAEPAPPPVDAPQTGLDLYVRIPNKVHIWQSPLDLWAHGAIELHTRPNHPDPEQRRRLEGKLNMVDGALSLGGKLHDLKRGHFVFNRDCPSGCMDLLFGKRLPPSALADVATVSAGNEVTIHMTGPLSDRQTVLGGAASPGTLFDLLSAHNAGRARYRTDPDTPATATVEFPQHGNLLALSFLSVNLPHLLFLDRIDAWADPYDGHRAYGQVEHVEAQRYTDDGRVRVRATKRPRDPVGQSEAEVGVDWLWSHPKSRAAFGAGVTGGSRAGGGPSLFFEWSSAD